MIPLSLVSSVKNLFHYPLLVDTFPFLFLLLGTIFFVSVSSLLQPESNTHFNIFLFCFFLSMPTYTHFNSITVVQRIFSPLAIFSLFWLCTLLHKFLFFLLYNVLLWSMSAVHRPSSLSSSLHSNISYRLFIWLGSVCSTDMVKGR